MPLIINFGPWKSYITKIKSYLLLKILDFRLTKSFKEQHQINGPWIFITLFQSLSQILPQYNITYKDFIKTVKHMGLKLKQILKYMFQCSNEKHATHCYIITTRCQKDSETLLYKEVVFLIFSPPKLMSHMKPLQLHSPNIQFVLKWKNLLENARSDVCDEKLILSRVSGLSNKLIFPYITLKMYSK